MHAFIALNSKVACSLICMPFWHWQIIKMLIFFKSFWLTISVKHKICAVISLLSSRPISVSWERSGSVVECLTRGRRAAGSRLTGIREQDNNCPSLVLAQPRKTRRCLTVRLLMGRKESNQTNKYQSLDNLDGSISEDFDIGCKTPNICRDKISPRPMSVSR